MECDLYMHHCCYWHSLTVLMTLVIFCDFEKTWISEIPGFSRKYLDFFKNLLFYRFSIPMVCNTSILCTADTRTIYNLFCILVYHFVPLSASFHNHLFLRSSRHQQQSMAGNPSATANRACVLDNVLQAGFNSACVQQGLWLPT